MPRHGIVHLATHGIAYSESPLDSLIALGVPDGATLDDLKTRADYAGWAQGQFLRDSVLADGQRGLLTARQIVYLPLPTAVGGVFPYCNARRVSPLNNRSIPCSCCCTVGLLNIDV